MHDENYAHVLREELDDFTAQVDNLRTHREGARKLLEHLAAERKALQTQKEERLIRSAVLLRMDALTEQYHASRADREKARADLSVTLKSYNRLRIATGQAPLDEDDPLNRAHHKVQGSGRPNKDELLEKQLQAERESLSQSLRALPLASPVVVNKKYAMQDIPAGSLRSKMSEITDLGRHSGDESVHTRGSKAMVQGILRKKTLPPPAPPRPKRKSVRSGLPKGSAGKGKARGPSKASPSPRKDIDDDPKQGKHDGQGDMTDFLDAIGYYSPTEDG
jgi:hypothetical protein